ncbi:hypothetical protein Tco_0228097 [Tanacetum coccineum]
MTMLKDEGPDFEEDEEEATLERKQQQAVQAVEFQEGLIQDHILRLDTLSPALPEGYDRDPRELYTRPRAVRDEIFLQQYRLRSLEQE